MRARMAAAGLFSLIAARAFAQDLSACTSINDDARRLRCYDSVSGRPAERASTPEEIERVSETHVPLWERRIAEDAVREPFALTALRPSYLLVTHLSSFNREPYASIEPVDEFKNEEVKFNISLQFKLIDDLFHNNGDVWFGYTQTAYWQVFSRELSSPFREVDYEPESYLSFVTDYPALGLRGRALTFGVVHQSNGRSEPLSRSWNRVYAELQFVRGDFALSIRPWLRLAESAGEDDNPDIERYLGHYELNATWEKHDQLFRLMLRNVFDDEHRINAELNWSFPISGRLRGLVQWYYGYGENLIDYNHKNNRIGIGVMISDWL